jgi:hypothetical protein
MSLILLLQSIGFVGLVGFLIYLQKTSSGKVKVYLSLILVAVVPITFISFFTLWASFALRNIGW